VGNFSLTITSIREEPYSLVGSVLANRPIAPNLTFVPEVEGTEDEVLYYFLIALVLILIVIFTFIKTSPQDERTHYKTLPYESSKILVLEEEEEEINPI
jgi:hypothetical protein